MPRALARKAGGRLHRRDGHCQLSSRPVLKFSPRLGRKFREVAERATCKMAPLEEFSEISRLGRLREHKGPIAKALHSARDARLDTISWEGVECVRDRHELIFERD